MYVKPYNCYTEDMIINNLEKTTDEKITIPFHYLEIKKSY